MCSQGITHRECVKREVCILNGSPTENALIETGVCILKGSHTENALRQECVFSRDHPPENALRQECVFSRDNPQRDRGVCPRGDVLTTKSQKLRNRARNGRGYYCSGPRIIAYRFTSWLPTWCSL